MKLYNLFNEIIFEETHKQLLTEGVSDNDVIKAIDGKYNVNIMYKGKKDAYPTSRYIQVYVLGTSLDGNNVIRAYQISSKDKTKKPGWRLFLTDNISGWNTTNMKWHNPVSDYDNYIQAYNQLGDKSMSNLTHQVDPRTFTRQRSDISQKPTPNNDVENKTNNVSPKPTAPTNNTVDTQQNNVNQQLNNDEEELNNLK
jgi:hypothetical protein